MAQVSKKVFITGIEGFTGVHLEKYLISKGYDVFGSCLKTTIHKKHFQCNILDSEQLFSILNDIKPDFIFHLAAISYVASAKKEQIYTVNIFGTLNLLEVIEKLSYIPQKIVVASSATVYGNKEGILTENICPEPLNHYGNSKLVMENMVKKFFNTQNIIITRPFNYTGVGHHINFLIPKIVSHYKKNEKNIALGNLNTFREYNDVNFVVECYEKLLLTKEKSLIVNICSGKTKSIGNIISIMNTLSGYEIEVTVNPKFIRKNEIWELKGSNKKLLNIIGEVTSENNIEKTLLTMLNS